MAVSCAIGFHGHFVYTVSIFLYLLSYTMHYLSVCFTFYNLLSLLIYIISRNVIVFITHNKIMCIVSS